MWDRDSIDLVRPAFIEISTDGNGSFPLIAVGGTSTVGTPNSTVVRQWRSPRTEPTKGNMSRVRNAPSCKRMARYVATATSTPAITLAFVRSPSTCPSNAR